jgi:hypothetical protein
MLGLLAGTAPGQRAIVPIDQPRFLQVELLEVAPYGSGYYSDYSGRHLARYHHITIGVRVIKVTYHSGTGLRAGISLGDGCGIPDLDMMNLPSGSSTAPVHIGYDIVFNPRKTGFFYGVVPACYVEATLGAFPLYAKVAAACDIDYWGLGVGAEAGCFTCNNKGDYPPQTAALRPTVYMALKLRLLDAAFPLRGWHD